MTKTFKITIGILILLALAAVGVFSANRNKIQQEQNTEEESVNNNESDLESFKEAEEATTDETTEEIEEIIPDTNIDTSNWKTYRNEEYGFELRYPSEYGEVESKTLRGDIGTAIGMSFSNNNLRGGMASTDYSVGHGVPLWIFGSGYFQYSEGKCQSGPADESNKIQTIGCEKIENSADTSVYFAKTTSGEGGMKVIAGFIPFLDNIKYKVFILENSSTDVSSENQLKQILSTFHFLNQDK